ncbi:hypothetical protein CK203_042620 [Vitis vinifera]|uniref:Retrovirus-related Pol polyprotein from transposon TNT 1-94-like beta-barrel domain-containing protein n=1 Tax=Vitis vinifera TaxID=29760 RepID=A0A438I7R8_VITVI|nr:hypothetical protein CK203_042620 [Vitis vinifera]
MKKAMMTTWSEREESSEEEKEKEVENMCFMTIDELDEDSKNDKWFLDSGYSRYMTGDESKFAFLTKRKGGHVTFGDNAKGRIIGQCNIDTSSLIESVLLVDGLKHNLLSIVNFVTKAWRPPWENCKLNMEGNKKKLERIPRKKNHLCTTPRNWRGSQQVQGESSQDLLKDWKFVINHTQYQIIGLQIWDGSSFSALHSRFQLCFCAPRAFCLGERQLPLGHRANALLSHLNLLRRRLAERQGSTRPSSALWRIIRVREFYSRVTYGLGGPNISTVRGVEIQLDPESIYRIFDIAPIGLRTRFSQEDGFTWGIDDDAHDIMLREHDSLLGRMKFEKAPNGSWIRSPGLGELSDNQHRPGDRDKFYTTRPYSQPSFTESPHTEPSPHQAPHVLDHAPWMDLSTQISSIGTRMEELVVVSDTRFYSMEDHMDQYQTGFTSQFEYLQQRFERMEDRMNQQQTAFDHL